MVECGWDHNVLNEMSEEEFCFWRDQRREYDQLVREATEEEIRKNKEAQGT